MGVEIPVSSTREPWKRLASLGAMAYVGSGPEVAEPTSGSELCVGESLTTMRQDLTGLLGCSIEVVDDPDGGASGETMRVRIWGSLAEVLGRFNTALKCC